MGGNRRAQAEGAKHKASVRSSTQRGEGKGAHGGPRTKRERGDTGIRSDQRRSPGGCVCVKRQIHTQDARVQACVSPAQACVSPAHARMHPHTAHARKHNSRTHTALHARVFRHGRARTVQICILDEDARVEAMSLCGLWRGGAGGVCGVGELHGEQSYQDSQRTVTPPPPTQRSSRHRQWPVGVLLGWLCSPIRCRRAFKVLAIKTMRRTFFFVVASHSDSLSMSMWMLFHTFSVCLCSVHIFDIRYCKLLQN